MDDPRNRCDVRLSLRSRGRLGGNPDPMRIDYASDGQDLIICDCAVVCMDPVVDGKGAWSQGWVGESQLCELIAHDLLVLKKIPSRTLHPQYLVVADVIQRVQDLR